MSARQLTGFKRTSALSTVGTITMSDGPECGVGPGGPGGAGSGGSGVSCIGAPLVFHYVQLPRIS